MEVKTSEDVKTAYSYDEAVELTGHGRYNYLLVTACSIIILAFALDVFGYAVVVSASSCDLQLGMKETGFLASIPFAGIIFAFPWGYYADTQGRRKALLLSNGVGFMFAAASSLAGTWQVMLVVKLLGCIFTTASFSLTMTIVGECTSVKYRSQYMSILNSFNLASEVVGFVLAYLFLSLKFNIPLEPLGITYRPWRLLSFVMSLLLLVGAVFIYFLYESPKYLASRGENARALEVLKRMYEINGGKKDSYPVKEIITEGEGASEDKPFFKSLSEHTVPIFKPPLLWRTLQLFFLMLLCCTTNNIFSMWFPTIVNIFFKSFAKGATMETGRTFCDRINDDGSISTYSTNVTMVLEKDVCNDTISASTLYSGMVFGLYFVIINLIVATVASRPRLVLITILVVAGVSANLINMTNPVVNLVFMALVQTTSSGIGFVASYFVELYPTSNRALVSSLGMMMARIASFIGVNVMGAVINTHCSIMFYFWSVVMFSGVVAAIFLPPDRKSSTK